MEDPTSRHYYNNFAAEYRASTISINMTNLYSRFLQYIPQGGRILDAGCGPGRDAKAFKDMGYFVDAFDASEKMVLYAREHTGLPVQQLTFAELEKTECYDGVWACASLVHLCPAQIDESLNKLATSLVKGGVMFASFKYGSGHSQTGNRLFYYQTEESINATPFAQKVILIDARREPALANSSNGDWLNVLWKRDL